MKLRAKRANQLFFKEINPIIRFLIISDVLIVGSTGMLAPLFALFVEDFIIGGDAVVVSIAMGIYLIARSILQIPIAQMVDRKKGEKDDYFFMITFSVIAALLPLILLIINQAWQLFLLQFALGVATAITYPSYMAIFTRHIDKNKEGTEWGVYYTLTDLGSAILAIIGGYIAKNIGFYHLIITMSLLNLSGSLFLLPIKRHILK